MPTATSVVTPNRYAQGLTYADFLARDRRMANAMPGDFLAVCTAGAYGFVQSSNYNSRPRAPEVLVEAGGYRVIRKRETFDDLIHGETV